MSIKLKEAALKYNKMGFSVIPLYPKEKRPMINEWQRYCTTRSTQEEIKGWWSVEPDANVGIACGPANSKFLFVVDQDVLKDKNKQPILHQDGTFEQVGDLSDCPPTISQTSGSGGHQLFYWAPPGCIVRNSNPRPLIDVRGLGGQVVVPPSIHPNGKEYKWNIGEIDPDIVTEIPKKDLDALLGSKMENKKPVKEVLSGVAVGKGLRHSSMAQVAGIALRGAKTEEQVEIARLALYWWDQFVVKSPEPFYERKKELDNTIEGIWRRENANRNEKGSNSNGAHQKAHIWAIGEILKHDFGEEEWFVESLISKQGITALSGNPGDFKTWVTIHIALCMSRNVPVFSKFKVVEGNVLIIDEEDHLRLIKKRLELLGAKETDNIHYLSQNGLKMDDEKVRDAILQVIKAKNIKLLILDSLVRVHQQDENDAKGMAKVFSCLQKIISAGASILFTHHHRKQMGFGANNPGQSMRGSSDILAAVDCHITIEKKRDEPDRLIIKQTKLRQAETLQPFEISVLKGEFGPSGFEYAGGYDEKKKKAEEASETIMEVILDGMKSRIEIIELLKGEFGKTSIEDGIKLAEERGDLERVPKEEIPFENRRKAYYRLTKEFGIPRESDLAELPASLPLIDIKKQEGHEVFEKHKGKLSECCRAPMVDGGIQCPNCGSDGRTHD